MHDLLVTLEAYEFILAEAKDLDVMKAVLDGSQHWYVGQHDQGNDADKYKGIPHKLLFYVFHGSVRIHVALEHFIQYGCQVIGEGAEVAAVIAVVSRR